jgi:4'-phosphopantetheinyl transferase
MQMPSDDQVLLWISPVPAQPEAALLERHAALLDDTERARWQRLVRVEDRQRFLLARGLVRTVLAGLLGEGDPAALRFTHNAHGKPALAASKGGQPLEFNLSHTDGLLVLAVSRGLALGVDVEALGREVDMLALSARFFSSREHAELQELAGGELRERFFALWTLKEAWLKARGLGLHIPLDDFSFNFAGKLPVIAFGPQLDCKPGDWQFRLLQHGQFRIALAVQRKAELPLRVELVVR